MWTISNRLCYFSFAGALNGLVLLLMTGHFQRKRDKNNEK